MSARPRSTRFISLIRTARRDPRRRRRTTPTGTKCWRPGATAGRSPPPMRTARAPAGRASSRWARRRSRSWSPTWMRSPPGWRRGRIRAACPTRPRSRSWRSSARKASGACAPRSRCAAARIRRRRRPTAARPAATTTASTTKWSARWTRSPPAWCWRTTPTARTRAAACWTWRHGTRTARLPTTAAASTWARAPWPSRWCWGLTGFIQNWTRNRRRLCRKP